MRIITLFLCTLVLLAGCITHKVGLPVNLLPDIKSRQIVAVSSIHEEATGNLTGLGALLCDKVEARLEGKGVVIKARKDIAMLIDDAEIGNVTEEDIWRQAGADIIVRGSYAVLQSLDRPGSMEVKILLKAYRLGSAALIDTDEFILEMRRERLQQLSQVTGNIFQEEFVEIVGDGILNLPHLAARLNNPTGCYTPGEAIEVDITSEPGAYIYLFNLSCDGNVTLLYPNTYIDNAPLKVSTLIFPPQEGSNIRSLRVSPAREGKRCDESFKLVATRTPLDFSFLPFPANRVFGGVNGRDIAEITRILKQTTNYADLLLPFTITEGCKSIQ